MRSFTKVGIELKVVPNCITISRIVLALTLLFFEPLGAAFLLIYILCGFTDLIDGHIARRTGMTSSLGAKLDSVADMTLVGVSILTLYPFLGLTLGILLWIFIIAFIRVASLIIALHKFKTYASIHTYGNKLTGLLLFITPLWLSLIQNTIWTSVLCIVATLSAIEELLIQITSSQLQLNRKGLFTK